MYGRGRRDNPRVVRFEPWLGSLRRVLRQDTLLSELLSPLSRCRNGYKLYHQLWGGGTPEGRILARYYCFNSNISFTFQAIKNLYAHITYLRFGLLCKFCDDFGVCLGINSFSERKSEIYGNRKFWRFDVALKLELVWCTGCVSPRTRYSLFLDEPLFHVERGQRPRVQDLRSRFFSSLRTWFKVARRKENNVFLQDFVLFLRNKFLKRK